MKFDYRMRNLADAEPDPENQEIAIWDIWKEKPTITGHCRDLLDETGAMPWWVLRVFGHSNGCQDFYTKER
jgi:hypothetical protein